MKTSNFLRKTLVEKIKHVYQHGVFVTDILFNQYKVNLIRIDGSCFEIFINPASLAITSISPLDRSSVRMGRYKRLIPLAERL